MPGANESDEFGHIVEALSKNELVAFSDNRGHRSYAECQQLFSPAWIVQNVNRDKVDVFFRKKLFRSEAAASSRLGEQNKFVSCRVHMHLMMERG